MMRAVDCIEGGRQRRRMERVVVRACLQRWLTHRVKADLHLGGIDLKQRNPGAAA